MSHPIDEILRRHGIRGPWTALPHGGLAKRIYLTERIVIALPTGHAEALPDARTESVAAPVARAAGIRTPRLLCFDETCTLVDRPYSLWERVIGQPLRQFAPEPLDVADTWRELGRELARLHTAVSACPDPRAWLDRPAPAADPRPMIPDLVDGGRLAPVDAAWLEAWIDRLASVHSRQITPRFLHGDAHGMNVMCDDAGGFVALIDWGDAGWGDPAIDVGRLPVTAWQLVLAGHEQAAPGLLGDGVEPLILWERIEYALVHLAEPTPRTARFAELQRIAREPSPRWQPWCVPPPPP